VNHNKELIVDTFFFAVALCLLMTPFCLLAAFCSYLVRMWLS
jgi:lauroyl/myristoyl acyltransferase